MMKNWFNNTAALKFLLEYLIFFIGLRGDAIFISLHKVIVETNPETFGLVCTMVFVFIFMLYKQSKR